MNELERLLRLRDELALRVAGLPAGEMHDAVAFEIAEIDLRLRELWSGEDSGVKHVLPPSFQDDRRGVGHGA